MASRVNQNQYLGDQVPTIKKPAQHQPQAVYPQQKSAQPQPQAVYPQQYPSNTHGCTCTCGASYQIYQQGNYPTYPQQQPQIQQQQQQQMPYGQDMNIKQPSYNYQNPTYPQYNPQQYTSNPYQQAQAQPQMYGQPQDLTQPLTNIQQQPQQMPPQQQPQQMPPQQPQQIPPQQQPQQMPPQQQHMPQQQENHPKNYLYQSQHNLNNYYDHYQCHKQHPQQHQQYPPQQQQQQVQPQAYQQNQLPQYQDHGMYQEEASSQELVSDSSEEDDDEEEEEEDTQEDGEEEEEEEVPSNLSEGDEHVDSTKRYDMYDVERPSNDEQMNHFGKIEKLYEGQRKYSRDQIREKLQKKKIIVTKNRHCSWCFQKTDFVQVESHTLKRNTYKCNFCYRLTHRCTLCGDGMTRSYEIEGERADLSCFKCQSIIPDWSAEPPKPILGRCSWCFQESQHSIFERNLASRNTYECSSCHQRTVHCMTPRCKEFARCSPGLMNDARCAACKKLIPNWDEEVIQEDSKVFLDRWCSWCISSTKHELCVSKLLSRDTFICQTCRGCGVRCEKCDIAMARCGEHYDRSNCVICSHKGKQKNQKEQWEDLERQKNERLFNRTKESIIEQLQRSSKQRRRATKIGMLRPFLMLVGMPFLLQCQICNILDLPLFHNSKIIGDPHKVAWYIISAPRKGLQDRMIETHRKIIRPVYNTRFNWCEVLEEILREVMYHPQTSLRRFKKKYVKKACSDPKELLAQELEEIYLTVFMREVLRRAEDNHTVDRLEQKLMTGESVNKTAGSGAARLEAPRDNDDTHDPNGGKMKKKIMRFLHLQHEKKDQPQRSISNQVDANEEELIALALTLAENAGISRKEVLSYSVDVAKIVTGLDKTSAFTALMQLSILFFPTTGPFFAPILFGLSTFAVPLFIISFAMVVWNGLDLMLRSTEGMLLVPIQMIIVGGRISLASEGICLEDYYDVPKKKKKLLNRLIHG